MEAGTVGAQRITMRRSWELQGVAGAIRAPVEELRDLSGERAEAGMVVEQRGSCLCVGEIGGEQVLMDGRWVGGRMAKCKKHEMNSHTHDSSEEVVGSQSVVG